MMMREEMHQELEEHKMDLDGLIDHTRGSPRT